jgi:hypothetical protein
VRESTGRNKGREEGDVRTIRRGWMLRTVWPENHCLFEQRFFCCEQRFSVHCGIGCEPVIFCGLLACCEQGTECSGL